MTRGSRHMPTVTRPTPPSAWRSHWETPDEQIRNVLRQIQNDLFDAGADLSTPVVENPEHPPLRITQSYIDRLEAWCDEFNEPLPALNSFVLPGGTPLSALLHVARTVARRAERSAWQAVDTHGDSVSVLPAKYLNRLSDLLFILSRVANPGRRRAVATAAAAQSTD